MYPDGIFGKVAEGCLDLLGSCARIKPEHSIHFLLVHGFSPSGRPPRFQFGDDGLEAHRSRTDFRSPVVV
jgi:hypothetical protein